MNDAPQAREILDKLTPDFSRDVYCVLGLTLDAVNFEEAKKRIALAVERRQRLFLTTPNMNFVSLGHSSAKFRNSVLCSDLCTADGMPLVWISRLLGAPIRERVSGSNLFSSLIDDAESKLRVFLFGGEKGTAQAAADKINELNLGVQCVGHFYPGFTSVDKMSDPDVLKRINDSDADFLLLALGAQKGQFWILDNEHHLSVPVISHLGSTINYVAHSVRRAPRLWQSVGLEWLWRIKEEPHLWKRYFTDFSTLIQLSVSRVVPSLIYKSLNCPSEGDLKAASLDIEENDGAHLMRFNGAFDKRNLSSVRLALHRAFEAKAGIVLDFQDLKYADSAFLGLILLAYGYQARARRRFSIRRLGNKTPKILYLFGCDYLMDAVESK
jgi:N-acetylglucosaminyldiphosphoundecaprenol N-acetyl-beta-D-mannosaminyltransferase